MPAEAMADDVEFIAAKLKEQVVSASEESEILSRIRRWADADATAAKHGRGAGTPLLDAFILKLKLRNITRSTARSGFMETTVNVFDTLFHELQDDRLAAFRELLSGSTKHAGSANASPENSENFWSTMGKQQAMGGWGMMKGLSQGMVGMGDAMVWAGRSAANLLPGVNIHDPGSMSKWVGKQLDVGGDLLFDNAFTKDPGLLGAANAGEIGTVGGQVIWNLVNLHFTAGAGSTAAGGAAGAGVAGMKVADYAGKLKAVDDSLTSLQDYLLAKREAGKLSSEELWEDAQFKIECMKVAGAMVGVVTGTLGDAAGSLKVIKEALELCGKVFNGIEKWAKLNLLVQLLMDDSMDPKAQTRAVTTLVEELVVDLFGFVGEKAAEADKAAAVAAGGGDGRSAPDQAPAGPAEPGRAEAGSAEGRPQEQGNGEPSKAPDDDTSFDFDGEKITFTADGAMTQERTGFAHPEVDGQTAQAAKEILGKRISDFPALVGAWNEAKEAALGGTAFSSLTDSQKIKLYDATRRRFWAIVQGDDSLREIFTGGIDATPLPADGAFTFTGGNNTAPVLRGGENLPKGQRQVWTVSLDHADAKKSTTPDRAVDPDNLEFVMSADNTMLNKVEAKVLGSARP